MAALLEVKSQGESKPVPGVCHGYGILVKHEPIIIKTKMGRKQANTPFIITA